MKKVLTLTLIIIMAISCKKSVLPSVPFGADCVSDTCAIVQDGDISQCQFGLSPISDNLAPSLLPISSGAATSTTAFKLIDSGASFIQEGVLPGYTVKNITDGTYADVVTVDSETQLTLTGDIFVSGETYEALAWTLAGMEYDELNNTLIFDNSCLLTALNVLQSGKYYKVVITTSQDGSTGNLIMTFGGAESIALSGGATDGAYYNFSDDVNIVIADNISSGNVILSQFEIYEMSQIEYTISDCESGTIIYDGNEGIEYYETILSSDYLPTSIDVTAQITIDWESLGLSEEGCYCVCVKDSSLVGYNLIKNGGFETPLFWTIANSGAGWDISGDKANHFVGGVGDDVLSQEVTLEDTCYTLSLDADATGACTLKLLYDTLTETDLSLYPSTTIVTGTTTIDINNLLITNLKIICTGGISIDNISIKQKEECVECSCESICIDYRHEQYLADATSILIKASSSGNSLGYNFTDFTFEHQLRVFGKLRFGKYDFPDEEIYKKSNGETVIVSTGYEKYSELQIYQMPEALYDILSIMMVHSDISLTIGDQTMNIVKRKGGLQPNWTRVTPDAPIVIDVIEKTQNYFNSLA